MENNNIFCRCLYYSANALARNLTRLAEEEFAFTGLKPNYAFILISVNREPGVSAGKLAEILMLTPSTVTRFLDKLEDLEMVKRMTEGRSMLVFPTKKSVDLNENLKTAWINLYKRYIKILGEEFAQELTNSIYTSATKLENK